MSKHKKRKHKRVADPHDDYMQKRHAYWAACAKKGELTEEQAHTCDELEMFVSAVIVFSDISPKDIEMFERAWSFRDVFLRFACQPEDDLEPSFYFHEEERYRAAGARLCVTFCGLADYRPIPRNTKGRPAYRASNVLLKIAQNKKAMRYVRYQHKAKADSELLKRMDLVAIPCYHWKPWMKKNKQKNETTIGISVGRSCRWLCVSSELSFDFWGR